MTNDLLTVQGACEIIGHEAIVLETYLDSKNIWTWGIGVTDKSGHHVARYKDNPQSVEHCIEIYIWLLSTGYIPDVLEAFEGYQLTEYEFAAALSFHYNTGAIKHTDWVKMILSHDRHDARSFLETHYTNGGELKERRTQEAALFFDGKWSNNGFTTIWPVLKPSYKPDWKHGRRVDVRPDVEKALAA